MNVPHKLVAYYPGKAFPAVSLTGGSCALQCEHCRGHYLRGMVDAKEAGSLPPLAERLRAEGATGILVSGGCDENGRVPWWSRVEELCQVRQNGLLINLHTGLLDEADVPDLRKVRADSYSVDLVQSERTITEVLHLNVGLNAYVRTLDALFSVPHSRVVPHICVGLQGEDVEGELRSIDLASRYDISSLVLLIHVPTKGTPMRNVPPISKDTFLKVLDYAMDELSCPVLLGCMRPRHQVELEVESARRGVSGIAIPSSATLKQLRHQGYEIERREVCCALHL